LDRKNTGWIERILVGYKEYWLDRKNTGWIERILVG